MYIEPNSTIRLLHSVPLDDTYDHTLYFSSSSDQSSYFMGQTKQVFTRCSYLRENRKVIKLEGNANNFYDCNYVMYQNTSFGSKWFYAFIVKPPEYINNNTFSITIEIDDMQTWMFDYTVDSCFVEREHSATDTIGENLLPENVDLGEYVCGSSSPLFKGDITADIDKIIVFTAIETDGSSPVGGEVTDGVYQGLKACVFNADNGDSSFSGGVYDLNTFLTRMTQNNASESIVSIVMVPSYMTIAQSDYSNSTSNERGSSLDGYTPRNKKLFTYPYNFMTLTNGNGQQITLRYEYFGSNVELYLDKILSCTPAISVTPKNYKRNDMLHEIGSDLYESAGSMDETIAYNAFPKCSYTIDSFRAYLAQSYPQYVSSIVSVGASAGLGLITGGLSGMGSIGGITSMINTAVTASIQPNKVGGNVDASDSRFDRVPGNIWKGRTCVCYQNARVIDNYFDRYGYNTSLNKVPNTHSRPHWNYVKTKNCTITGSIPTDSAKRICDIFNNGVTFWKNASEVGNYSLNNSV